MAKSKRRELHEEAHGSHERWLITYADMITLLMVLFIVLFAVSQVDQKRFDMLREGMAAGFGQQPSPFQGDRSVLSETGAQPLAPIRPVVDGSTDGVEEGERAEAADSPQHSYEAAKAEVARLDALRRKIREALAGQGLQRDVAMRIDERGLRISLVSRHIVFRANRADLSGRGVRVLAVLAPVLRGTPNEIEVAGHTNQVKVKPKFYPTDWELSAARAVTVLRHLTEKGRVPTDHMMAAAYGQEQPLIDPAKPGSQDLNKRVDIVVLSAASDDVRRQFAHVLEGSSRL